MNEDNRKKLYDALSQDYDMGTFEQFSSDIKDEGKRKKLYDATSKEYDYGDYERFSTQLGYPPAPKPEPEENKEPSWTEIGDRTVKETSQQFGYQIDAKDDTEIPMASQVPEPEYNTGSVKKQLESAKREQVASLSQDIDNRLQDAMKQSSDSYMEGINNARKGGFWKYMQFVMQNSAPGPAQPGASGVNAILKSEGRDPVLAKEIKDLETARRAIKDAQAIIAEADKNELDYKNWWQQTFAAGAARGFGEKLFDARTWDMGATDLQDGSALMSALDKFDQGEELTESEKTLLDAKSVELATNAFFGSYIGRGYKAGSVTAESIPFMIEMCINPASGVGKTATSKLTRYALKRFGKKAIESGAGKALYTGAKIGTRVAGDAAGAAAMAGTTGAVGVAADAVDRMNGEVQFDVSPEGQSYFSGYTEGDDPRTAFRKAFASRAIENHSEMLGQYFQPVLGVAGKGIRSGLDKIGLSRVNRFIDDVSTSDLAKIVTDFERHSQWNGLIGEYAEEVAGGIENAIIVGDQTLDSAEGTGVFNLDQNIDTFLGVSLMGGVLSSIKTAGYRTPKYRARKAMLYADANAQSVFGDEEWNSIKSSIEESSDDTDAVKSISDILASESDAKKKAALLDYIQAEKFYNGTMLGETKRRTDPAEDENPVQADMETSYDNGYSLENRQEMNDAKNMFDFQQKRLGEVVGVDDITPEQAFTINDLPLSDEQKQVAVDYLNAKATYEGMIDHVKDDIDSRINAADRTIDGNVNVDTGRIVPATMKVDDRKVYVVGGQIAMNDDNTMIDRGATDETVVVRDAETGKFELTDPSNILRLDGEIDPEEEKTVIHEQIRQSVAAEAADKIDGVLPFNIGDVYTLTNDQGQSFPVQIVANEAGMTDNGDGTVNVVLNNAQVDGQPVVSQMPRQDIQNMADATNLARLAQYEQQKTVRESETAKEIAENEHPYSLGDVILLKKSDGNVTFASVVSPLDSDGKIQIESEQPIDNGKRIAAFSREELEGMLQDYVGQVGEDWNSSQYVPSSSVVQEKHPVENPSTERIPRAVQENLQKSAFERIPVNEAGEQQFEQAPADDTWKALVEMNEGNADEAKDTATQMLENTRKALEKAEKAKTGGNNVMDIQRHKAAKRANVQRLKRNLEYWTSVVNFEENQRKAAEEEARRQKRLRLAEARRIQRQNGKYGKEDVQLGDYLDFRDYVMRSISNGFVKFKWADDKDNPSIKGLGSHLGLTNNPSERVRRIWMLSNEDGMRPEAAAETMLQSYAEAQGMDSVDQTGIDTMSALDEILDVIRSYDGSRSMFDAAKQNHSRTDYNDSEAVYHEDVTAEDVGDMPEEFMENAVDEDNSDLASRFTDLENEQVEESGSGAVYTRQYQFDNDPRIITETNAPDDKGNYTGATYDVDGHRFGDLIEVADYFVNNPRKAPELDVIERERNNVNTEPTEAQKEAGNYRMGHVNIDGLDISIENPKGSTRKGRDASGKEWQSEMHNDYGYIRRTGGVDGDHIDVFLSDNPLEGNVYVIDQVNKDGSFDEHKVMYGFGSEEAARDAYLSNYEPGWDGLGNITEVSKDKFRKWIDSSRRKTKPFAEYASMKYEKKNSASDNTMDTVGTVTGKQNDTATLQDTISSENKDIQVSGNEQTEKRNSNRLVSDERYAELRSRMREKLGQLNTGFDPEMLAIGCEMAAYHIEKGARIFVDYAKAMIADLGDAIRPYLKSFYNGARDLPGMEQLSSEMDNHSAVSAIDVNSIALEQAETRDESPELQQIQNEIQDKTGNAKTIGTVKKDKDTRDNSDLWVVKPSEKVTSDEFKELKDKAKQNNGYYSRFKKGFIFKTENDANNFNVIENGVENTRNVPVDEQTRIDTATAIDQGVSIGEEAATAAEDKNATNNIRIAEITDKIDNVLDRIDEQLAILGYYEADYIEKDFNEAFGYVRNAERKAVRDANRLAKKLAADLGVSVKGKAKANIAPVGGDITFRLELLDGRELYVNIALETVANNLKGFAIYHRVENPESSGPDKYGTNVLEHYDVRYNDFLEHIRTNAKDYLPEQPTGHDVFRNAQIISERMESDAESVSLKGDNVLGDLFADLDTENDTDIINEDIADTKTPTVSGFNIGDKIIYQGKPAIVADFENGRLVLDTGNAPIMYELADVSNVEPIVDNQEDETVQGLEDSTSGGRQEGQSLHENGALGESQWHKTEPTERGGMDIGSSADVLSDEVGSPGLAEQSERQVKKKSPRVKKNTRNNRVERGVSYAPTTPAARFRANLDAISLMKRLVSDERQATGADMEILRQYTGWGGLGSFFNDTYSREYRELNSSLTPEEMQSAEQSINSAYFTPVNIIDNLWDLAKRLGFKGGRILEGSAGVGNILASMPKSMSESSDITAVEIDSVTGNILKLLYPDADIHISGFESVAIDNNSVDLAITNVPFVTGLNVYDEIEKDLSRKFRNIHDFCIAKNVRKLKEGGIGIFITSSGTLDKSKALRQWVVREGNADFIGAFRLNNDTFGGTKVTSDIIVIRKRIDGVMSPDAIDVSSTTITRKEEYEREKVFDKKTMTWEPVMSTAIMEYNNYFIEHPENMAGEMLFGFDRGETFRPGSSGLYPVEGKNQDSMLAKWVKQMHGEAAPAEKTLSEMSDQQENESTDSVKEGQIVLNSKNEICISRKGKAVPLGVNANKVRGYQKSQVLEDYNAVKTAINAVLDYQMKNESDSGLKPLLKNLNDAYDTFSLRYGSLNKNVSISFLKNDVDFPAVAAIENYSESEDIDGKKKVISSKTDIFTKRVIGYRPKPTPSNTNDGVLVSMNMFGRIDIPYIASTLGKDEATVKSEILESGLGFIDPKSGILEVRYDYLSGNVREKLQYAREHNQDGAYDKNIEELERVIPLDIPAHLIDFSLGSDWIDYSLYLDYARDKFGLDENFKMANIGGVWQIVSNWFGENNEQNRLAGVTSEKVGKTVFGHQLMLAAMNNTQIVFSKQIKHYDGTTETVTDKDASTAATAKMQDMKADFKEWSKSKVLKDDALGQRISETYNNLFNAIVPKTIDSQFLPAHFDNSNIGITLYPHQKKAVIRATTEPLILAHEVGTGKTFTLLSTAMEMKRLGTAKKPMIVVQNATVGQFVNDAKLLYPGSRVLTVNESDRTVEGRAAFYAKIKYNDWDMVIVPQSVFEMIPDSEERQRNFIQEKIDEKIHVIEQAKVAGADSMMLRQLDKELEDLRYEYNTGEKPQPKGKRRNAKKEALARENASVRAKMQLDRRTDDVANFDEMDIDALLVDEAHAYKHLGFDTQIKRGVKGIDPSYSKRSAGLYLKIQSIFDKVGRRNVVFATGTPISNTAAEIWTFMKYLMDPDVMRENHIYYFDDFVRNFGDIAQNLEFATNGKFKETTRFSGYMNVPELVRVWSSVSDTVLSKEAEDVSGKSFEDKLPEIDGGKAQDIFLPQSPSLVGIMNYVKSKLQWYENLSGKEKRENSSVPLTMYTIAQRAAIDPRLVDAAAADEPLSKTNKAIEEILSDLNSTESYKGTVAVFCDNYRRLDTDMDGRKHEAFNLFKEMKRKLVAAGVPENQIVIMESGMTVNRKQKIFDQVNDGEVRVIFGTTQTLGTGVNIQRRLHAVIHMDAPNRPMDYTQRNGRIRRQGNLHKEWGIPVRIIRFGVEDSLDVTAYQRLKTKDAFINTIMNGKVLMANAMEGRSLEEAEDGLFDNAVAQLSGSEYAMLVSAMEREIRKLNSQLQSHNQDQIHIESQLRENVARIERDRKYISDYQSAIEKSVAVFENGKVNSVKIEGVSCKNESEMADILKDKVSSPIREYLDTKRNDRSFSRGELKYNLTFDGINVTVNVSVFRKEEFNPKRGFYPVMSTVMEYSCPALGITDRKVAGNAIKEMVSDFVSNIATGRYMQERISSLKAAIARMEKDNALMRERRGKPFKGADRLRDAREKLSEYQELMKKEMAEKEEKYAKAASVEVNLDNIDVNEEDDSIDSGDANRYRMQEKNVTLVEVNRRFNEQLELLTEDNADSVVFDLGRPSDILLSAGVSDKPMKLYGNKVIKKMKKHGFALNALQNLPEAVANPIAVFNNIGRQGNRSILTELKTEQGNFLVTVDFGKGKDLDFNMVSSVFGKGGEKVVEWINKNYATYINKEKALDYLYYPAPIAETPRHQELSYAANIVENFENPKLQKDDKERIEVGAINLAESLGSKLNVIRSTDEIKDNIPNRQKAKRLSKGWYVTETGEVVLVLPNAESVADAEATILHEVVGHKGLRAVVGDRNFDNFIDKVYEAASVDTRRKIMALARNNGWDFRLATEEYIASLAESGFNDREGRSFFEKVKDLFMDLLRKAKITLGFNIGDNELRYMLWRSYQLQRNLGAMGEAENIVMQQNLKVGSFRDSGIKYRTSVPGSPVSSLAQDTYNEKVRVVNKDGKKSGFANLPYRLVESYQDSMLSLKTLQDSILSETGNKVEDYENAYIAENAMSSQNKAQADIYRHKFYEPIQKAVATLMADGVAYEDIQKYLIAKHGLERNEVFSKRDAEKDGGVWDGKIKDYSGLTALTDDPKHFTDIAEDMVKSFESEHDVKDIWKAINAATRETLYANYSSGLMSKAAYDKVKDMFSYYIPLRGWDTDVAANEYEYLTSGRPMLSPTLKTAKGRKSLADDPIATIGHMAESAIIQGNRNLMKQKFLNFVLNNPTSLATVSEQWYVIDPATKTWEPRNPSIPVDADPDTVSRIVQDFENDMLAEQEKGNATRRRGGLTLGKHSTIYEGQEHVVRVMRSGKEYCIYINGNPRAAQALNGLTNPDAASGKIKELASNVRNFMARMFTSQNPAFIVSNLSRDVIWAGTAVAIKENAEYTRKYTGNIAKALAKGRLVSLIRKFNKGELDDNIEIERYFNEFIVNGGETGFTNINTIDDFKRDMKRFVKDASKGGATVPAKLWRALWDGIEFMNRCAEDTTRFMVYLTSRQMGRSVQRSVYDAKEITVNFNKKGSGGYLNSFMNFAYIFFNATVQSLANVGKLVAGNPLKAAGAFSTFTAAGVITPLLALVIQEAFGGDDDDEDGYFDLPEWVRRNNLVFYIPWSDNGYLTIPLPHELRPFYSIGELSLSVVMGKETFENAINKAAEGFTSLIPIDFTGNAGNTAVNLTPTIAQPFAQLVANTDYFGKPIYRSNDYNELDPEWTKAYKGTNQLLVDATKWLSEITGGNNVKRGSIELNPALMEHLYESYFGGVGKTLNRSAKTISMIWDKDMREWRNVPVASSFYQKGDERTSGSQLNREYFDYLDEHNKVEHEFAGYKRQLRMGAMEYAKALSDFMESPEFQRYRRLHGYVNAISRINSSLKYADAETREDMEEKIRKLKRELVEELHNDEAVNE